jgi:tRNA (guanine37-N1)-methyltransferase
MYFARTISILSTKYLKNFQQIRNMKFVFDKSLKGLKVLDRDLFTVDVKVPALKVEKHKYGLVKALLKDYTVDFSTKKSLYDLDAHDPLHTTHKLVLFDADLFDTPSTTLKNDLIDRLESEHKVNFSENFVRLDVKLTYDNFKFDDIVRAILPDSLTEDNLGVKGFSIIGHIAHFNFRDELLDYKKIIGNNLFSYLNILSS